MRVFVVAGEPSGDKLGQAVMSALRAKVEGEIEFAGVGGPLMKGEGLKSLFPMSELSVMGLAEILPKYRHLKRRIRETAEAAIAFDADIVLTIDSPDFCLRVARMVRARRSASRPRLVHYVAPSVWAWRPGRAEKMARCVDHVLALLPFEPPMMEVAGVTCDFVGHPVVAEPTASPEEARAFRATYGLDDAPVILALPGSRRGEVTRLAPIFGETLARVLGERPGARIVIPAAGSVMSELEDLVRDWPGAPLILAPATDAVTQAAKRAAFAAADVALAASGTVSLELAASGTPMVIGYDMNWITRQIVSRMLMVDTVTLVNLVSDTRAVPEFLGKACRPTPMAEAVLALLDDPGAQQAALSLTMDRLGRTGLPPGERAAISILRQLDRAGH
ncbi:lipid-A-disaccharide synthase [Ponticoccus sp. SC2-23]|uniref:lipid-A-disaccharide synthase n=1 Tax=Alexandriicola marinus TaxID=2081710 RepID=UPI000FD90AB7|nr:lipid-A-disaccharide synthase [Alexandriicola marinus]MBM1218912.1 lipid-A-disaccharide synthase [Ponticoccus sp. SC6-9]MBM1224016.1 lipid-A-disaccharide synthase [Ponticoccus sp. SC6-15]MBM1230205.1 lipid-A-disaccharide synthase [Ponticoccus sp. SC6-38]MBM1232982.1 lipid-A-disaccharide synthase [Ponticoccus sp. SC6-45]MBM1237068.1 lipid-A-disaccharide synthase [Ponticoccus sp. SC6-49]MBM1241993.1 lipid-A-disaccharide synthase [Ponticoccus sp. SC2-64]MBM1246506.1 lipid-A-disaccharide synt